MTRPVASWCQLSLPNRLLGVDADWYERTASEEHVHVHVQKLVCVTRRFGYLLLNETYTYVCLCVWFLTLTHSAERMRLCRFAFRSWCSLTRLHHSSGDDNSYTASGTKLKSSRRDLVCWASVRQTYERFIENGKLRKALEDIPLLRYT